MSIDSKNNIIIGISGGIAAYKTPDLIRRLRERGSNIKVVMTKGGKQFITPLTIQAVSGQAVRDALFDTEAESGMDHIELARWADKIVIAPASANIIARLANGLADDLLTTMCLATNAPIYIAPAMNQQMWQNPATQRNVEMLKGYGVQVLGPDTGDQACGETGPGRMLEPVEIATILYTGNNSQPEFHTDKTLSDKKILITAGPTWEAIDPVRGLTNHSSGKMGYAIASAFSSAGFKTTLISGPTSLKPPAQTEFISVISAQQMHNTVHEHIGKMNIFISVAAVADYRPEINRDQKIKKTRKKMQITLIRNTDILSSVSKLKNPPFTVGFAAETENIVNYATDKMIKKNIDMIIANQVGDSKAFGQDENELTVITKDSLSSLGPDCKQKLANQLVSIITKAYENKHST